MTIEILEYPSRRDRRDHEQRYDEPLPPLLVATHPTLEAAARDVISRWEAARAAARRGGGELADHYRAEYSPRWEAVEGGRELLQCWGHCELTGCDQARDHEWTEALGAAQYAARETAW